jgi:hypothetical protein
LAGSFGFFMLAAKEVLRMFSLRSAALALPLLALTACAMQRAQDAEEAQRRMIGLTKERVFACMGIPNRKATEGNIEIWSYKSGNEHRETSSHRTTFSAKRYVSDDDVTDVFGSSFGLGDSVSEKRFCTVQIVMTDGKVEAVHYNGPTGGFLTDDEQCAYAVRNCLDRRPTP